MATRHRQIAKLTLIASIALLLSSSAAAFGGVAVGLDVGFAPPPVPVAREVVAPCPGPGYAWVAGHYGWYPGHGYRWARGTWLLPPHPRAVWVGPRFVEGPRGRFFVRGFWRRRW